MHPLRQVHDFLEQAVETVPDEDAFFHRLDVDVARLALDRALHHEIDQVDDRRRFAAFLQPGGRFEHLFFDPPRQRGLAGRRLDVRSAASRARRPAPVTASSLRLAGVVRISALSG